MDSNLRSPTDPLRIRATSSAPHDGWPIAVSQPGTESSNPSLSSGESSANLKLISQRCALERMCHLPQSPAGPPSSGWNRCHTWSISGRSSRQRCRAPSSAPRSALSAADLAAAKIVFRVELGRSRLLERTCAGHEPRSMRLFGRRHHLDSNCWYRVAERWISATPPRFRSSFDSPLEGDGFEPSVPREGPSRRDGFIRLSSGGSEAHHQRSEISTARSGRRSPPGP